MKRSILIALFIATALSAFAQYPVGHRQITFQDPARSNRSVPIEIYYPAVSAGENTTVASGPFPLIVFGHGFVMGYDAYAFWKDHLAPSGYIIAFPTTEGSMSPSHADFGADLAFLLNKLQSESNSNSSSPFYQKLSAYSAIMGHSMGGGSSFLACEGNTVPTCMVTFAAAETTPSSTTAAANVTIPALVLSGAEDCVAPPASHQTPMYNALASTCKVFISIVEGVHCYFGDYNFNCTFGESTCNPVPTIQRADQLDVALDFTMLYLNHYLRNDAAAWDEFTDSLSASTRITYLMSCPQTGIEDKNTSSDIKVYPNPSNGRFEVMLPSAISGEVSLKLYNLPGSLVASKVLVVENNKVEMDCSGLSMGTYILNVESGDTKWHSRVTLR
jgi:predicted dienelactone hydrolase